VIPPDPARARIRPRIQRVMATLGCIAVKLEGASANDQPFVWESEIGQITVIITVCAAYARAQDHDGIKHEVTALHPIIHMHD